MASSMTYRVFSRNASSSRAIPVERLIRDVIDDPAMPVLWGKNQKGMQAAGELDEGARRQAIACWLSARDEAVHWAQTMANLGAHKQHVNRVLEPWCHINVVVTATDWANFFALRCHPDAQPEMRALAVAMRAAMASSTPKLLRPGEWHLPYVQLEDAERVQNYMMPRLSSLAVTGPQVEYRQWVLSLPMDGMPDCLKIMVCCSVARCARVSYLTHEGKQPSIEDDLRLYDRLVGSTPLHSSPAEHQATPDGAGYVGGDDAHCWGWMNERQHGNLRGWRQYRKMLPGDSVPE